METALQYLLDVLLATLTHLAILLAPILLLGLIMHLISQQIEKLTVGIIGMHGYLYLFGWIGTAVHELGHLIFALIFGHHISNVKLFSFNASNPEMGYVKHTFNKKNIYQNLGNFFIGIGPILLGGSALFIIGYFLLDINFNSITNNNLKLINSSVSESIKNVFYSFYDALMHLIKSILHNNETVWWKYLLFFYLLFAIGSSISLSKSDIKGSFSGLLLFIALILLFNLTTLWLGDFAIIIFTTLSNLASGFYLILFMSIFFNLGFLLLLWLISLAVPAKTAKKEKKK
ncbi:MAG: hypothetical protein HS119_07420 [Flavobacteriales bacterium]|nr:hypothetical protein [Flavobacteriales bacterium]MCL4856459.1 hypothetical protein [Flavobacteriales bacterium]